MPPARPARSSVGGRWWHEHDSYSPRLDFSLWRRRVLCSWPLRRQWPRERSWFAPGHCRGALARWWSRRLEFIESETLTPSLLSTTGTATAKGCGVRTFSTSSHDACPLPAADALWASVQKWPCVASVAVVAASGL